MMITRIILAGATIVALGAPSAQAGSLFHLLCGPHVPAKQCAVNFMFGGTGNNETIKQTMTSRHGFQFALQAQDGSNNNAYTEQVGKNQVALTFQNGDNNSAYTYQEGKNQLSTTVQNGNGMWAVTTVSEDNTVTHVEGSN